MTEYRVTLVKDSNRPGLQRMGEILESSIIPGLADNDITFYGAFIGLFGLATNELYLITNSATSNEAVSALVTHQGLQIVEATELVPTVRPKDHSPRTNAGVYVFRWFDIFNKDVDEIARLSGAAWLTFEGGFDAEVQGLFAEKDQNAEKGKMLLLTWYRDLTVWQESRQPPATAAENFRKRHALTIEAKPIATRRYPRAPD